MEESCGSCFFSFSDSSSSSTISLISMEDAFEAAVSFSCDDGGNENENGADVDIGNTDVDIHDGVVDGVNVLDDGPRMILGVDEEDD